MNTPFDDYTKRAVGDFNPETAAYLYEKQHSQQGGYLKLRHPAIRFISRYPLLCVTPVLGLLLFALFDKPSVQTQQVPASNGTVTVNNVVNISK